LILLKEAFSLSLERALVGCLFMLSLWRGLGRCQDFSQYIIPAC
jgi:hypothetical protein